MLMSIPAVKGVEIGMGFEAARRLGSEVHDPIESGEAGKRESASADGCRTTSWPRTFNHSCEVS
jgi:chorismate synthase